MLKVNKLSVIYKNKDKYIYKEEIFDVTNTLRGCGIK